MFRDESNDVMIKATSSKSSCVSSQGVAKSRCLRSQSTAEPSQPTIESALSIAAASVLGECEVLAVPNSALNIHSRECVFTTHILHGKCVLCNDEYRVQRTMLTSTNMDPQRVVLLV